MFRVITYSILFLTIFLLFFEIIYKVYCEGNLSNTEISFFVTTLKDIFNILFFGGVLTITILSYLQAKKSLFTPIKTETFKMQIKAFEEILLFFQNKGETDFTHQFDIDNILKINAQLLQLDFIEHFFKKEIEIDAEKVDEMLKNSAGSVVTQRFMEKHFTKPNYHEKESKKEKIEITNPAIILNEWNEYEYGKIDFTIKYSEEIEKLKNLSASPLLPEELKEKINEFEKKIHENLTLVGKVLTDISKELPTKFPNSDSLKNFNSVGIWNTYNSEMNKVENDAEEILKYIRKYLKIDELIK